MMTKKDPKKLSEGGIHVVLTTEKHGRTLVVKIGGELDLSTSPKFREVVEEELKRDPYLHHLVLDFSETGFIDSSGLGVILGRFKQVSQKGGKLSAINVPGHLLRVFELSGLMRIMEVFKSLDEALVNIKEG
jgi:stage II sporulation protein AA (anti-sigma F factor antagonist)